MNTLESLRWRYATKKFDAQRSITDAQLTELLEAGNLTASSYGLQPYKLLVIQNQDLQNQLVPHSYNQQQVADASHVIVIDRWASNFLVAYRQRRDSSVFIIVYRSIGF